MDPLLAARIIEEMQIRRPTLDTLRATAKGLRQISEYHQRRRSSQAAQVLALADRLDTAAIAASQLA